MSIDVDRLPPVQYLILEVLAARYRLGEVVWPFSAHLRAALRALEQLGLISVQGGNVPQTMRASLTESGKLAVLSASYPLLVTSAAPAPDAEVSIGLGMILGLVTSLLRKNGASEAEIHKALDDALSTHRSVNVGEISLAAHPDAQLTEPEEPVIIDIRRPGDVMLMCGTCGMTRVLPENWRVLMRESMPVAERNDWDEELRCVNEHPAAVMKEVR